MLLREAAEGELSQLIEVLSVAAKVVESALFMQGIFTINATLTNSHRLVWHMRWRGSL